MKFSNEFLGSNYSFLISGPKSRPKGKEEQSHLATECVTTAAPAEIDVHGSRDTVASEKPPHWIDVTLVSIRNHFLSNQSNCALDTEED